MIKDLRMRFVIILAVVAAGLYYSYPLKERITLGLDLSGGIHLVLRVETDKAIESELLRLKSEVEKEMIKRKINFDTGAVNDLILNFNFKDSPAREQALEYLKKEYAIFQVDTAGTIESPRITIRVPERRQAEIRTQAFDQAIETIRNRIDETGVKEPTVQREGLTEDRILIQLPGLDDPERAKRIIGKTAFLEFRMVKEGPASKEAILNHSNGVAPYGFELLPYTESSGREQQYYLVEKEAQVTGVDLVDARVGQGQYGQFSVNFELNRYGGRKFADLTEKHVGENLAIVLDGRVQSAPRIKERIPGQGQITGSFSRDEARDLAIVLRAGALPAPVTYLEERSVGPSLGQDSINQGIRACLIGLAFVLVFMVVYYKTSGLIADFALILNAVLITGALGSLHATLTLPGIAGMILTLAMAVDANILIYERLKEELRMGKTIRTAVENGFSRAFVTIFDSNLTTLISSVVLLIFGSGPVRGFGFTLTFGLLASMFTAVFVSHFIFDLILRNRNITSIRV